LIKPGNVTQPVGLTNLQWQTATFSVISRRAADNYRWLRQGVNFFPRRRRSSPRIPAQRGWILPRHGDELRRRGEQHDVV
jgi:hypothetical protein